LTTYIKLTVQFLDFISKKREIIDTVLLSAE
jgi:hypothetical protein